MEDYRDPARSLQGDSVAQWNFSAQALDLVNGSLKVTTSHLKAGYLRKNGVPYSDNASLTEYYDLVKERNGGPVDGGNHCHHGPVFLREPFIVSSHFKKLADNTGWNPNGLFVKMVSEGINE